jgi:hypothetical protein
MANLLILIHRCFLHIVNLACQAVILRITDMKEADAHAPDYEPGTSGRPRDVIALLRNTIRAVSDFLWIYYIKFMVT